MADFLKEDKKVLKLRIPVCLMFNIRQYFDLKTNFLAD